MYTQEEFSEDWRNSHPMINVDTEAPYYYDVFGKVAKLSEIGKTAGVYEDWRSLKLMIYIEIMGHLALGKPYQKLYRSAEYAWKSLVDYIGFDTSDAFNQALAVVEDAIKNAPKSALVEKLNEAVVNVDSGSLLEMLKWLVTNSVWFDEIVPYSLKEEHFQEILPGLDKDLLHNLAILDSVLCWKDKEGYTITQRIASSLGALKYTEAHNNLLTLKAKHIDAYRIKDIKGNGTVEIESIKRTIKGEISLSEPLPDNYKDMYIVGNTVLWDKLYLCKPYTWVPKLDIIRVNFDEFYKDMLESIKHETHGGDIQLCNGDVVNAYAEFYGKGKAKILWHNSQFNAWRLG